MQNKSSWSANDRSALISDRVIECSAEPTFTVDLRKLELRYKQLQKDLHPDKFGNQESKAQEFSAEQSSLVNHAYVKLKSPLQRALYLVGQRLVGISFVLLSSHSRISLLAAAMQAHLLCQV